LLAASKYDEESCKGLVIMSTNKKEIIPAESLDKIPLEDEIEIGLIMDDIERILHGDASTNENDFERRAKEMFDKLQRTFDWLYRLRQIERVKISKLQGSSALEKIKAVFKGESIGSQIDKLDRKVMANQELTNLYNEIIFQLDSLLKKRPVK
jgi:hypothetical protein